MRARVACADAPCWTHDARNRRCVAREVSAPCPTRPDTALSDYARQNGWDRPYPTFDPPEIPNYIGAVSFCKRPVVEDAAELARRRPDVAIVGAPFDDAVSYRPGARFGPRAIRQATYTQGGYSLQLDVEPFEVLDVVDAGDANVVPPGSSAAMR